MIDGHPGAPRLSAHLLDLYEKALPQEAEVTRVAVSELDFDPIFHGDYSAPTAWEPDLVTLARDLDACDHLVLAFPMWWGGPPAQLKGLFDRLLLPHFAFRYHENDALWDPLLEGRSADVIVTMDTPPLFLRFMYDNAVLKQTKRQVLRFCGFKPVRLLACGPVKQGGAKKGLAKWQRKIERMASSIKQADPAKKEKRAEAFLSYRSKAAKPHSAGRE